MSQQPPDKQPRNGNRPEGPNVPGMKMGRSLFTWLLVIGLAVMLIMLFNQTDRQMVRIAFSEFDQRLSEGKVKTVLIEGDEIQGEFTAPQMVTVNGANVQA